ncbi:hypothetical protein [Sedimentibacter sp.]|uniref:hypothetical protein n=1 Tax=Sedimentibacter sp. TaxID=1960295 RepID=UPI0028B1CBF8|nr:hypothetical protein [Sedimentibacter sp.]
MNYKIIFVFALFTTLLFNNIFTVNVFASTKTFSTVLNDFGITEDKWHVNYNNYEYIFIKEQSSNISVLYSNVPFLLSKGNNSSFTSLIINGNHDEYNKYTGSYLKSNIENVVVFALPYGNTSLEFSPDDNDLSGVLFTSANLEYNGVVFFSQIMNPILEGITSQMNLGGTLTQVIGLIPLLMGLVVGFLALRKAWGKLSTIFRQA